MENEIQRANVQSETETAGVTTNLPLRKGRCRSAAKHGDGAQRWSVPCGAALPGSLHDRFKVGRCVIRKVIVGLCLWYWGGWYLIPVMILAILADLKILRGNCIPNFISNFLQFYINKWINKLLNAFILLDYYCNVIFHLQTKGWE